METLMWIVKNGDLKQLKDMVEQPDTDINAEFGGRNALHFAADYGHNDVIEFLLASGADINAKDKFGLSPILCAIYEGHVSTVKLLLKKGADKEGMSPDDQSYMACADTEEMKKALS